MTPTVASIYKNSATLSNTAEDNIEKRAQIHALMAQEAKRRDEFVAQLREFQLKDGLKPDQNEFGMRRPTRGGGSMENGQAMFAVLGCSMRVCTLVRL